MVSAKVLTSGFGVAGPCDVVWTNSMTAVESSSNDTLRICTSRMSLGLALIAWNGTSERSQSANWFTPAPIIWALTELMFLVMRAVSRRSESIGSIVNQLPLLAVNLGRSACHLDFIG